MFLTNEAELGMNSISWSGEVIVVDHSFKPFLLWTLVSRGGGCSQAPAGLLCPVSYITAVFSNRPYSVCGEPPLALALTWVVWRFLWGFLGRHPWLSPIPGAGGFTCWREMSTWGLFLSRYLVILFRFLSYSMHGHHFFSSPAFCFRDHSSLMSVTLPLLACDFRCADALCICSVLT